MSNNKVESTRAFLGLMREQRSKGGPLLSYWSDEWRDRHKYPKDPLPIDDRIRRLLGSSRRPRIDLDRHGINLELAARGPYRFARGYLILCYHAPSWLDEQNDVDRHLFLTSAIERIGTLRNALGALSQPDPNDLAGLYELDARDIERLGAPTAAGGIKPFDRLDHTAREVNAELTNLEQLLYGALRRTVPTRASHRPRLLWKRWFVRHIGQLWTHLTDEEPASNPGSKFADFVGASWESLGDVPPDQSFNNALRDSFREDDTMAA